MFFLKNYRFVLALCAIWAFSVINNFIWIKNDHSLFIYDPALNMMQSISIFKALLHPSMYLQDIFICNNGQFHPFFVGLVTAPIFFICGINQLAARLGISAIFLAVLIIAIYKIGVILHSKGVGLLSALIISFCPTIFHHQRTYMYDFPLTAMVSLTMLCYLLYSKTKLYSYAIILGIIFIFSFLTRISFTMYMFVPLIYSLCNFRKNKNDFFVLISILIAVAALVIFPYLYINKAKLCFILSSQYNFLSPNSYLGWSLGKYLIALAKVIRGYIFVAVSQISYVYSFIFIAVVTFFLKWKNSYKLLLFIWFVLPIMVLTYFRGKGLASISRYLMPSLPVVVLIISVGIFQISSKIVKIMLIIFIVSFGILQYYSLSFGIDFMPKSINALSIKIPTNWVRTEEGWSYPDTFYILENRPTCTFNNCLFAYPGPPNETAETIINSIRSNLAKSKEKRLFVIGYLSIPKNGCDFIIYPLRIFIMKDNLNLQTFWASGFDFGYYPDFILVSLPSGSTEKLDKEEYLKYMEKINGQYFILEQIESLTQGNTFTLYKKISSEN